MAKTDITGLLTGVSKQGIDPLTAGNFAQRTLARQQQNIGTMQRGLGGLISGKPPVEQRLAKGIINKQKQQKNAFADYMEKAFPNSGVRELVETGVVTPDNFRDFFGTTDNTLRQGKRYTVRDEQGNLFAMTTKFDNSIGSFDTLYAPIGDSPDKPVGKIEILTTEGVTFGEKEAQKVKSAEDINSAETFKSAQMDALSQRFTIADSLENINRGLELINSTPTGGPIKNIGAGLQKFLGTTPSDRAELEYLLAKQVLNNLKSTFGGAITEGERQYLIDISANITRGNAANLAIFNNLREIQLRAAKRNDLLLSATNYAEYVDIVKGYKFEDFDSSNTIDFSKL